MVEVKKGERRPLLHVRAKAAGRKRSMMPKTKARTSDLNGLRGTTGGVAEKQAGNGEHQDEAAVEDKNLLDAGAEVDWPEGHGDDGYEECDDRGRESGLRHAGGLEAGEADPGQAGEDHAEVKGVAGIF